MVDSVIEQTPKNTTVINAGNGNLTQPVQSEPVQGGSVQSEPSTIKKDDSLRAIHKFFKKNDLYLSSWKQMEIKIKQVDNKMIYIISIDGHNKYNKIEIGKEDLFRFADIYSKKYSSLKFTTNLETYNLLSKTDRINVSGKSNEIDSFCLIRDLIFESFGSNYYFIYNCFTCYRCKSSVFDRITLSYSNKKILLENFLKNINFTLPNDKEISKNYFKDQKVIKELCAKHNIIYNNAGYQSSFDNYKPARVKLSCCAFAFCTLLLLVLIVLCFILGVDYFLLNRDHVKEITSFKSTIETKNAKISDLTSKMDLLVQNNIKGLNNEIISLNEEILRLKNNSADNVFDCLKLNFSKIEEKFNVDYKIVSHLVIFIGMIYGEIYALLVKRNFMFYPMFNVLLFGILFLLINYKIG